MTPVGGEDLARAESFSNGNHRCGETLTVTMDGQPIAELRPVPGRAIPAATLLKRWRQLPPVDAQQLRAD
jgi:antitoxin (DNA-binding transcriptional repressor) of toxin-antitoxin stability system